MRQIVLDTETTGLEPEKGHRVIEIGALELSDRRSTGREFHVYINPERDIDEGALEVHGITREFLSDKPRFAEIAEEFLDFVAGAELVIHNAPFDMGFLDYELGMVDPQAPSFSAQMTVLDTLDLARDLHPGQKNNLDALCRRYGVDNSNRSLHGALLDAGILADVYLAMTGGQTDLGLSLESVAEDAERDMAEAFDARPALRVQRASAAERELHAARLQAIVEASGQCIWPESDRD